jgi:di/tricarboxylate transporter
MALHAWITSLVLLIVVAVLARERLPAPIAVLSGVVALILTGVITPTEGFSGFASEAPITIAALFVLAGAAKQTGALDVFVAATIGRAKPGRERAAAVELVRILVPSALLSTVVYNTPVVSLLAPQVTAWAKRMNRPPSWYLLPLNYAVLLGGLITAIGTTTNVVTSGLLVQAHLPPLGLLELAPVAAPVAVVGIGVMILAAPHLMPRRVPTSDELEGDLRDFALHLDVEPSGPLVGMTVTEAGLRNLQGTFLVQLLRNEQVLGPVGPAEVLRGEDRLTFVGNLARVMDLRGTPGLAASSIDSQDTQKPLSAGAFFEAVLSQGSSMVGGTLKELDFRAQFDSAVIAIHRDGERLTGKLGEVRLRGGDVLLLLAGPDATKLRRGQGDFLVVAALGAQTPVNSRQSPLVLLFVGLFLVCASTGLLDVVHAALAAASALLVFRIVTPTQARSYLDVEALVTLSASFGLGAAVAGSGLAGDIAQVLSEILSFAGDAGALIAVLLATAMLTQVVTNNAAAIVMFPIALAVAASVHQPSRPFVIAVVIAASLSFLTPFGYQTNLIVAGLANYRSRDFLRLGGLLLALTLLTAAPLLVLMMRR